MRAQKSAKIFSFTILIIALVIIGFIIYKSKKSTSSQSKNEPTKTSEESPSQTTVKNDTDLENNQEKDKTVSNIELAKKYYLQKNYQKALDYYLLAIGSDKNNLEATIGAGNCYRELKNNSKAIEYYTKVIGLDKKNITAYLNLSSLYKDNNNITSAKNILELGLKNNPGNEDLQNTLDIIDITGNDAAN